MGPRPAIHKYDVAGAELQISQTHEKQISVHSLHAASSRNTSPVFVTLSI
jgi:hypothetical protein